MSKIIKIILAAMLLALLIVLNRFVSIKAYFLVISLSFIPIMMSAIWLGPKYSTLIALLGDLIGALLFPFGPYFPGFTLSMALTGLVYGLFLYNKGQALSNKKLLIRITVSSLIHLILINIFLTSLWVHMLYGKAYIAVMISRTAVQLAMIPIHIVVIYGLEKFTRPFIDKYLFEREEEQENDRV